MARDYNKVSQRISLKNTSLENKVRQANARIREFEEKGISSPAEEYIQQYLQSHKHGTGQNTQGQEYNIFDINRATKQEEALDKFLSSKTGTVKKQENSLRQSWQTFTDKYHINRRKMTFNKYKQLFDSFDDKDTQFKYEENVIQAISIYLDEHSWNDTTKWLDELFEGEDTNYELFRASEGYYEKWEDEDDIRI